MALFWFVAGMLTGGCIGILWMALLTAARSR
jgi:hypothetical protein